MRDAREQSRASCFRLGERAGVSLLNLHASIGV